MWGGGGERERARARDWAFAKSPGELFFKSKWRAFVQTHPSHTSLMMAERGFFCGENGKITFSPQSKLEFLKQQSTLRELQLLYITGLAQ